MKKNVITLFATIVASCSLLASCSSNNEKNIRICAEYILKHLEIILHNKNMHSLLNKCKFI